MASRHAAVVRVFDHEPELLEHVPHGEVDAARRRTVGNSLTLPAGDLRAPAVRSDPFDLGFLVLEGLLLRHVDVAGSRTVELLGPGDVIRPWRDGNADGQLHVVQAWKVCESVELAVLDRRLEQDVSRWPGVVAGLMERLSARSEALSIQLALARLPRLEDRLLLLFWHLATRFGRVEVRGVVLPLRLTQETLADLTASRRPSVSGALGRLRDQGLIEAYRPGRWRLLGALRSSRPASGGPRDDRRRGCRRGRQRPRGEAAEGRARDARGARGPGQGGGQPS